MKILLIGEYSNLHNSLKQGLQKNGFEVTLLSTGDGFKNFDSDIPIKSSLFENKFLKLNSSKSELGFFSRGILSRVKIAETRMQTVTNMTVKEIIGKYDSLTS